jgi:hypothetical protein
MGRMRLKSSFSAACSKEVINVEYTLMGMCAQW